MSRPATALMAVALLAVPACVEPVPGLPSNALASGAEPYTVRFVPASGVDSAVPGGALDAVSRTDVLTLAGWVPAESGQLLVVSSIPLDVVSQRRFRRPDAAESLGRPEQVDLGFELVLHAPAGATPGVCLLFRETRADAPLLRLPGASAGVCGLP